MFGVKYVNKMSLISYFIIQIQFILNVCNNTSLKTKVKFLLPLRIFGPGHAKTCLLPYAKNKGADQPAHPRSLTSAFVVRSLDSIISLDSIAEISRF